MYQHLFWYEKNDRLKGHWNCYRFLFIFRYTKQIENSKNWKTKGLKCTKSVVVKKSYINDLCRWKLLSFAIIPLRNQTFVKWVHL